jgi:hypothetical protein
MPLKTTITPTFISHFPPIPLMAIGAIFPLYHQWQFMAHNGKGGPPMEKYVSTGVAH